MKNSKLLTPIEKTILSFRSLYDRRGYIPYKMNKFEEYELYIRNKDFLVSDRIISFNDTNGSLLALKPDVTISMIKNNDIQNGETKKLYYDENVYRVSGSAKRFKEIRQSGLECMGDISFYDIFEVIDLAAESLSTISESFVIEVSLLDVVSEVISSASPDSEFASKAISFVKEKNPHDLSRLCDEYLIPEDKKASLLNLICIYGERKKVINALSGKISETSIEYLKKLSDLLDNSEFSDKIVFDFSVVNNMKYYNGFVFRGFIDGISDSVLAGGQYDKMMRKMGKKQGAIGFAIYPDMLSSFSDINNNSKLDALVLYDSTTDEKLIAKKTADLRAEDKKFLACKFIPKNVGYKEIIDLRLEGKQC